MILITGSHGFVGSHLTKVLKNYKRFKGEIRSKSNVDKQVKGSSIIIHLAALTNGTSEDILSVNIKGTRNIVEAAKKYKIKKIIFISTEYIFSHYKTAYNESKKKAEKIVKTFSNYIILRPTFIYGGGDKRGLGKIIDIIKRSYLIPLVGNGQMQPIYVKDVIQYIINSIKYNVKGEYLIAGELISFRDFVKLVARKLKKKVIILPIPFFIIYLVKIYEKMVKKPVITSSQIYNMNVNRTYNINKTIKDLKHKPLDINKALGKTLF